MSFRETGLLETLQQSLKYVPPYEIKQQMKERAAELIERGGILARSEIVLLMLSQGLTNEEIKRFTGLSIEEIEQLKNEN